jgi:hypothetical protein
LSIMLEGIHTLRGARIPGLRIAYQSTSGERLDADALYLGERGLFICTDKPLAAGGRFPLTIELLADGARRPAVGRVLAVRETGEGDPPPGMSVKLIDVEDAVMAAIERLAAGERTDHGVGGGKTVSRERTVLGTGASRQQTEAAAAPIVVLAPIREKTVLGVAPPSPGAAPSPPKRETSMQEPSPEGWDLPEAPPAQRAEMSLATVIVSEPATHAPAAQPAPMRDPSIAVDLSELERTTNARGRPGAAETEPSLVPAGVPRRRGRAWLLVLVVVTLVGGLGYAQRNKVQPVLQRLQIRLAARVEPTPTQYAPAPAAPSTTIPSTTTSPPSATAVPSEIAAPITASAAPAIASATTSASAPKAPNASSPSNRTSSGVAPTPGTPSSHPKRSADNPY